MNAPDRKIAATLIALAAGDAVSACAASFDPRTDATSPVAPRVQALVDANREYPRWDDFPRASEPLPAPMAIAARVNTLRIGDGALAGEVSRIDWQNSGDPVAFAADVQARIDSISVAPATAETLAEMEAYLRRARDRGRAPPPIQRR
jgi:hypothetical protein